MRHWVLPGGVFVCAPPQSQLRCTRPQGSFPLRNLPSPFERWGLFLTLARTDSYQIHANRMRELHGCNPRIHPAGTQNRPLNRAWQAQKRGHSAPQRSQQKFSTIFPNRMRGFECAPYRKSKKPRIRISCNSVTDVLDTSLPAAVWRAPGPPPAISVVCAADRMRELVRDSRIRFAHSKFI